MALLKMLYNAFIVPHVLLHIEIWESAPLVHMSELDIKLNTLLRILMGVQYVDGRPTISTSEMYPQLGLLRVSDIYKQRMFKLLITLLNGLSPYFYDLLLKPYISIHNYRTRGKAFRHPLVVCEVERRAVSYQLIHLYENVPDYVYDQDNVSLKTLVNKYKRHLLASY